MKKGQQRKQELLRIAYQLFITKGYEATSIDEIIEQAGIAKGTYYYYFESKEQTLEEVIDMMLEEEAGRAEAIMSTDLSIPDKIVGIISALRPQVNEMPIEDALNRPENILMHDKVYKKLIGMVVPVLSEVVDQGVKEGIFACDHIPERVRMLLIISRDLFDEDRYTEEDIDVFIDTVERILYAQPGTMGFIRSLITNPENTVQ